jgi:hypothetical protein
MTTELRTENTYRKQAKDLGLLLSRRNGMYAIWHHLGGDDNGYQGWDIHPSCWHSHDYPLTLWDVAEVLQEEKQRALNS